MNTDTHNLTQGGILSKLLKVALPVMGTQFMQMTYNLADMFWLGRVSSNAVAASGTAGMYLWMGMAFLMLGRMGAEIGVSQNLGRGDADSAKAYAHTSIVLAAALGVVWMMTIQLFHGPLIGFFNIQEADVVADAEAYLTISSFGFPFVFVTSAVSGCFSGSGNTKTAFLINSVGLIANMILDPLLIFGFDLGIRGAGVASVIAQSTVCIMIVTALKRAKGRPFAQFKLFVKPRLELLSQILKWGIPIAVESLLFTFLSMLISRIVSSYGAAAITVSRVGSQIESLSWLIAGGYSSALTAFVGQNYGAGKWTRIHKGFRLSVAAMAVWGLSITALLFFGARALFGVFITEPDIIEMGVVYLRILALCQFAACLEFTTAGCFRGMGRTLPPSIASITSNAMRVVLAYILSDKIGLNGAWWAICIGSITRGVWMFTWYSVINRRLPKTDTVTTATGNPSPPLTPA